MMISASGPSDRVGIAALAATARGAASACGAGGEVAGLVTQVLAEDAASRMTVSSESQQLDLILTMFTVLDELDTAGIAPTAQTIEVRDILRPDVVVPSLPQSVVLANAPERLGEHIVVPAIIGDAG